MVGGFAAGETYHERVVLKLGESVSLPVGRVSRPYVFGQRLFGALQDGGLLVWRRSGRDWEFVGFVPSHTQVSHMFGVGGAVYAVTGTGIYSVEEGDGRGPSLNIQLPIAWLHSYSVCEDGTILICNGASIHRYSMQRGLGWKLSNRWHMGDHVILKAEEQKKEAMTYVSLSGKTLVARTSFGRTLRAELSDSLEITKATVETGYGRIRHVAAFHGAAIVSNTEGLYLHCTRPEKAALQDALGELEDELDADGEEEDSIEVESALKALGEKIRVFAEPVDGLVVRGDAILFEHKGNLYRLPRAHVKALLELMSRGKGLLAEEHERYSTPPEPELVASDCAGKAVSFDAEGNAATVASVCAEGIRLTPPAGEEEGVLVEVIEPRADLVCLGGTLFVAMGKRVRAFGVGDEKIEAGASSRSPARVTGLAAMGGRLVVAEGGAVRLCDIGRDGLETVATFPGPKGSGIRKVLAVGPQRIAALADSGKEVLLLEGKELRVARQIKLESGRITGLSSSGARVSVVGMKPNPDPKSRQKEVGWLLSDDAKILSDWDGNPSTDAVIDIPYLSANYFPFRLGGSDYLVTSDTRKPGLLHITDGAARSVDYEGGVQAVLEHDGMVFSARGRYGLSVHRAAESGRLIYMGGTSVPGTSFTSLSAGNNDRRFFALHSGGLSSIGWVIEPRGQSGVSRIAGTPGKNLTDDGLDVTSWDYANKRGYAAPLKMEETDLATTADPPPHGVVYVDRKQGKAAFPIPQMRTVDFVAEGTLPHAFGVMCLQDENTLLVGGNEGMNLEWWDLSDPERSVLLAREEPSIGPPCRIKCRGDNVYVLSNIWGCGFFIYDAKDRSNPRKLGGIGGIGTRYSDFCLTGNTAIVRVRVPPGEVALVDISEPTKPVLKTKLKLPLLEITNRAASKPAPKKKEDLDKAIEEPETELEGGEDEPKFEPDAPTEGIVSAEEQLAESGGVMAMQVLGKYVFVPSSWGSEATKKNYSALFVCELGESFSLKQVGVYEVQGCISASKLVDGTLCLAIAGGGDWEGTTRLEVLDISSPEKPKLLTTWEYPGKVGGAGLLFLEGGKLWGRFGKDFYALKVAREGITALGHCDISSYGGSTYLAGTRLFVQHSRLGITELDVSEPSKPRVVRRVPAADGWGGAIDVCDGVAYVASEGGNIVNYQLQVLDVRNPAKPLLTGLFDYYREMTSPVKFGDRLFVIAGGGPGVLDVSKDALNPEPVRQIKEIGGGMAHGRSIRVWRDKVICCPMYGGKFGILERSKDGSFEPTEVVKYDGGCVSVGCDDRYLYTVGPDSSQEALPGPLLRIWDLESSPPSVAGQLRFEGWPSGARVDYRDGYLFVWIDRHGGWSYPGYFEGVHSRGWLIVVDVHEPRQPKVVTCYPTGALIESLGICRLDGDFLYIASYMGFALVIVDVSDPLRPVQVAAWRHAGQPFYHVGDIDIDGEYGYLTTPYSLEVLKLPLSGQQPRGELKWQE